MIYSIIKFGALFMLTLLSYRVNCIANFLILKVKENMGVFEYHVAFEPDIDSTSTRRKVVATLPDLGTRRTFDGAKLCLPTRLANNVSQPE